LKDTFIVEKYAKKNQKHFFGANFNGLVGKHHTKNYLYFKPDKISSIFNYGLDVFIKISKLIIHFKYLTPK